MGDAGVIVNDQNAAAGVLWTDDATPHRRAVSLLEMTTSPLAHSPDVKELYFQ
jgi:hypothetical protein